MDPKPEKLEENVILKFKNLKVKKDKQFLLFMKGHAVTLQILFLRGKLVAVCCFDLF